MSENDHFAAVEAALSAAGAVPYDLGKVSGSTGNSGSLPPWFTVLGVLRRFGGNPRVTTQSGVQGYRITTTAVGNSAANARNMRAKQHAALEETVLVINGEATTPIKFESAEPIAPDEGMFSGLTTWTYTH